MKIQLLSDLHLEVDPTFQPRVAPDADVLVLAGDIGARPDAPMAQYGALDWCLTCFSPALRHWPVPVLYLPGNHEYDGQDFDECQEALRAKTAALGMIWLEGSSIVLHGVRFIGSTLWSDFDCFGDRPSHVPGAMTYNLRMREKCFRAANFYLEKAAIMREGILFDALAMREEALRCQAWLRTALAAPHAGPSVVVTHFAPSLRSHDPRFGLTPGTAGFCSALDDLVPQADLWLHGHLHCGSAYRIGSCGVHANPLGYSEQGEQQHFEPCYVLEI